MDVPFLKLNTENKTLDKAMADMFISLLGYIAQNEREKMLDRQKQGIEQAKLRGVYKGSPLKCNAQARDPKDKLLLSNGINKLNEAIRIRRMARQKGLPKS